MRLLKRLMGFEVVLIVVFWQNKSNNSVIFSRGFIYREFLKDVFSFVGFIYLDLFIRVGDIYQQCEVYFKVQL